uniref:Reverse transcriptase Ty1/copia-type domain-containing protein n=1 Tax=Fagus sylvatica TaxID=28930 RepID=A0A2N9HU77_FAGSY
MSSSSTTTDSGSSTRTHHYPLLSSSTHLQIKLTKDNYLSWKTAITPYINGNKILHHIDGTSLPPPQYLPSSTSPPILVPNPDYLSWFEIDQLLLSILISTISDTLISSIVGLTSSRAVWTTLEKMFSSQSRARLMHTRYQLVTLKKGNLSITDFYQKAKQYSDLLASIGQPISDNDLIIHILGGLPTEYDSLVTTGIPAAHFAAKPPGTSSRGHQHPASSNRGSHQRNRGRYPASRGRSNGGPPHSVSNGVSHGTRPFCQICLKPGHTAPSCWHRFEQHYQATNSSTPQAYMAATSSVNDQVWYPDTGATNHMTADMHNLNLSAEDYMGNDQVRVGNGQVHGSTTPHGSPNTQGTNSSNLISIPHVNILSPPTPSSRTHIPRDPPAIIPHPAESIAPFSQSENTAHASENSTPIQQSESSAVPSHQTENPAPFSNPSENSAAPNQSTKSAAPSTSSAAPQKSTKSAALSHQPENPPHTSASLSSLRLPLSHHPMTTRSRANISKPKQMFPGLIKYPLPKALLAVQEPSLHEPSCFTEASKQPQWRSAMNTEFTALLNNGTWSLVPSKSHVNLVGCKWVFRIKRHADGSIERYKARLVAKGFHQQPGIDYSETFSPVIKPITIRTVLSLAVASHWDIRQLDVTNAFLHGVLSEDVYMTQPPGFVHPSFPNHICRLHKAIYGLKQAPRAWFSRLSQRLLALGFHGSKSDTSLFIHNSGTDLIFFLIYVDDIIVTGNNTHSIARLIQALQADFALKDLGPLHFFLGVQAYTTETGLFLSKKRYISDLLKKTNMHEAKPVSSPMSSSTVLSKFGGTALSDPSTYRSIVGSLQYLSLTRPDLAFAVNKVCQYMSHPTEDHWSAVKLVRMIDVPQPVTASTLAVI